MGSELLDSVEHILNSAKSFDDWIAKFTPQRKSPRYRLPSMLSDNIRNRCRELRNLNSAAKTPVSMAVYGASQSGKSLFVGRLLEGKNSSGSVLGTPREKDECALDFLEDLNPRDAVEATAVVTRFTLGEKFDLDACIEGYPVAGKLLNRSDLLKSVARGFKGECDAREEWSEDSVEDLLENKLYCDYAATSVDTDWRLDICEAHRFLVLDYKDRNITIPEDALAELLRRYPLTDAGYIELCCHFFWEDWRPLSFLFKDLLTLRGELGAGSDHIYMSWEVVPYILNSRAPKERVKSSHLSASLWSDFGVSCHDGKVVLGRSAKGISLRNIQGLICELIIPLKGERLAEGVLNLFNKADVLDIPGAVQDAGRSRMTWEEFESKRENGEMPEYEILKRGRVGYLFEKYAEEKQISTLLYMQKWGPYQAKSEIGPQLDKWGKAIYGDSWPKNVNTDAKNNLVIAMTQIDLPGFWKTEPDKAKFEAVIREELVSNLSGFMLNYGGDALPFSDVYILRHPGKTDKNPAFETKEAENGWRDAFTSSPVVQKHVKNTGKRWDAAFGEDGGLGALLDSLTMAIDGEAHRRRLETELYRHQTALVSEMQRFHVDTSGQCEVKRIKNVVDELIGWFESDVDGWRSKFFREAMTCDPSLISGALSDASDNGAQECNALIPQTVDYQAVVRIILERWESSRRWGDMLKKCKDSNVKEDVFISFSGYLKDYLYQCHATDLAVVIENLSEGHIVESPSKYRFETYSGIVFDDYLVTPGPREEIQDFIIPPADSSYAFVSAIPDRYRRILLPRLSRMLGDDVLNPPPGNAELGGLIASLSERNGDHNA